MSEKREPHARGQSALSPVLGQHDFPPLSALVQVAFGAQSRRGKPDVKNSDHYLIVRLGRHQETLRTSLPRGEAPLPFNEFGYGMVVADGSGEAASRVGDHHAHAPQPSLRQMEPENR